MGGEHRCISPVHRPRCSEGLIPAVMHPAVRYAGEHVILYILVLGLGVGLPVCNVGFQDYTARFYTFRATVTHSSWLDIVCSEWSFADSGINLIDRINGVKPPPCTDVPAYISFGKDVMIYMWRVDTWTTVLVVCMGVAAVVMGVAAVLTWLGRVLTVVKLLHAIAAVSGIIVVSSSLDIVDQMQYDGNAAQDVSVGAGLYCLAAGPFVALVSVYSAFRLCWEGGAHADSRLRGR